MRKTIQLGFTVAVLASALHGQRPTTGTAATKPFVIKANTQLVVEAVSVTADGEPVTGLTANDFSIREDGVQQRVAFCRFQQMNDSPLPRQTANREEPQAQPPSPTGIPIAPENAGNSYQDRRLLVLYFDMTSMPVSDQLRALSAAGKFIRTGLENSDRVAVMEYAGRGVQVRQDFTGDRAALGQALDSILAGAGTGLSDNPDDAASADTGSAFGQDNSGFNIFNTNRQLAALRTAIDMLAPITEKKSLVYFASGIQLQGIDNEAQLEAATNAAVKDNVAIYPIDARGLTASAPLGDASQGSPGGVAMYNGQAALALNMRQIQSQDSLYALGADTGGKALLNTNNLTGGIARARNTIGSYYIIGYYPTNTASNGKYRQVRITLTIPRPRTKLSYRKGYYEAKSFARFTPADKERQLEDALMLGNPITDLPLALEVNYFQLNSAEYFVPVAVKIPGSEVTLARRGNRKQVVFDFIGEVKDAYDATITNMRDQTKVNLSAASAARLERSDVEFNTGFTLLPGRYTMKLLARDDQTGKIGTYIKTFTIPNLERDWAGLPTSSVVLSQQRVALAKAAFNAKHNAQQEAVNPLVTAGQELIPSVTRVFRHSGQLYVFLEAYEREKGDGRTEKTRARPKSAAASGPLEAYVSFYPLAAGKTAVWRTPIWPIRSTATGETGAVAVRLVFALARLKPGQYICQVTVLDPNRQKASFWQAPMEIVP